MHLRHNARRALHRFQPMFHWKRKQRLERQKHILHYFLRCSSCHTEELHNHANSFYTDALRGWAKVFLLAHNDCTIYKRAVLFRFLRRILILNPQLLQQAPFVGHLLQHRVHHVYGHHHCLRLQIICPQHQHAENLEHTKLNQSRHVCFLQVAHLQEEHYASPHGALRFVAEFRILILVDQCPQHRQRLISSCDVEDNILHVRRMRFRQYPLHTPTVDRTLAASLHLGYQEQRSLLKLLCVLAAYTAKPFVRLPHHRKQLVGLCVGEHRIKKNACIRQHQCRTRTHGIASLGVTSFLML